MCRAAESHARLACEDEALPSVTWFRDPQSELGKAPQERSESTMALAVTGHRTREAFPAGRCTQTEITRSACFLLKEQPPSEGPDLPHKKPSQAHLAGMEAEPQGCT